MTVAFALVVLAIAHGPDGHGPHEHRAHEAPAAPKAPVGPCGAAHRAKLEGPSPLSFLRARFGSPRSACSQNELELAGAAGAIVEPDDLYGNISAAAILAGSFTLFERGEVFGAFELLRYQTVISSLSAVSFGPGDLTLGASWRFVEGERLIVTGFGRTLLPTTSATIRHARPFGVDLGVATRFVGSRSLSYFANLAVLGTAAVSAGPANPRGGVSLTLGGTWRPTHGFALVYEMDARAGYGGALDHLAVGVGMRAHRDRRGFELFFRVPVSGRERTLALVGLRLRYDFDVTTRQRLR